MTATDEIIALENAFLVAPTTDAALSFMESDGHVRYDYVSPLEVVGGAALRASFDGFFNSARDIKGRFASLHAEAGDTVGVANGIMHFTWKDLSGNAAGARFRFTHALRRKAGGPWKIFHSHVSFPMNPATGACDTNLEA